MSSAILDRVLRAVLTFPFWWSGLSKLLDFQAGVGEMAHFGLAPPELFNILTIILQLAGSVLIILSWKAWVGAGALAFFTLLTIPIAHHFWSLDGQARLVAYHMTTEHIGMIGALLLVYLHDHRKS